MKDVESVFLLRLEIRQEEGPGRIGATGLDIL